MTERDDARGRTATTPASTAGLPLTRASTEAPTEGPLLDVEIPELAAAPDFARRYHRRSLLGRGGMGLVELYEDAWIGREVALKTLHARDPSPALRRRFYQEMRVQGRLEHPSIVPVYDFGLDPEGRLYFTMRRVVGVTLKEALARRLPRHRLLTVFESVCQAVHHAHTRGVLHRDLKPANVMLGERGEVYVLDWGIATTFAPDAHEDDPDAADPGARRSVVGTLAYMAPEQILGRAEIDARVDVYALGVMLFEMLSGRALHTASEARAIADATLTGVDGRPSRYAPDVPPELDAICVKALARDPNDRFASAEDVADAVERYLEGDRDLELRKATATQHAERAAEAAGRAESNDEARAEAMREVVTALAFDPSCEPAVRTLVGLMVKVPEVMPAEVEAEIERSSARQRRESTRMALVAFAAWVLFILLGPVLGVRNPSAYGFSIAVVVAGTLYAWWMWKSAAVATRYNYVLATFAALAVASSSAVMGPFLMLPTGAAVMTLLFTTLSLRRERTVLTTLGVLSLVVPWALEALGAIPPSIAFEGGRLVVLPRAFDLPPRVTLAMLLYAGVAWIVVPPLVLGRLRDALATAERQLFLHAWHFRRLVPTDRAALDQPSRNDSGSMPDAAMRR